MLISRQGFIILLIMDPSGKRKRRQIAAASSPHYGDLTMKEIKALAGTGRVVIIPVGSLEEHGDHLPVNTDSLQPVYVAEQVARRTGCLIAPLLPYGLCDAARPFPGTITIEFDTVRLLMRDLLSEFIRQGFTRLLVLSGHAGSAHLAALRLAAREIISNHRKDPAGSRPRIMVCSDYDFAFLLKDQGFDPRDDHAGGIETSRMLDIRPDLVKGRTRTSFSQFPRFEIAPDPEKYLKGGIQGDPAAASAEKGRMLNGYVIEELVKLVKELSSNPKP